jgi:8-hydroxy-5-deazaflavin:NADPH oxidoreductase
MKIGIIGSGNVGVNLAKFWAKNGHELMLSYSRDADKLARAAAGVSKDTRVGAPREAVAFGEVIVLAVPWAAVADAMSAAGSMAGKILHTTVNALSSDKGGLAVGTTTSAAEEIAKLAPGARVVEALAPFAELLAAGSTAVAGQQSTAFCCGDDPEAKSIVAGLMRETGTEVIDAGPLTVARFVEPAMMLLVSLAYAQGMGAKIAYKLLR